MLMPISISVDVLFLLKSCWHVAEAEWLKKKISNVKLIMPLSLSRKDNGREKGES